MHTMSGHHIPLEATGTNAKVAGTVVEGAGALAEKEIAISTEEKNTSSLSSSSSSSSSSSFPSSSLSSSSRQTIVLDGASCDGVRTGTSSQAFSFDLSYMHFDESKYEQYLVQKLRGVEDRFEAFRDRVRGCSSSSSSSSSSRSSWSRSSCSHCMRM